MGAGGGAAKIAARLVLCKRVSMASTTRPTKLSISELRGVRLGAAGTQWWSMMCKCLADASARRSGRVQALPRESRPGTVLGRAASLSHRSGTVGSGSHVAVGSRRLAQELISERGGQCLRGIKACSPVKYLLSLRRVGRWSGGRSGDAEIRVRS